MITYHHIDIEGVTIFYRQAGLLDRPVFLLLHGFPSAGHMFRDLIPVLEHDFYIIAPDYPGFGNSDAPDRSEFAYTFDNLTVIMEKLLSKLEITSYAMYVFDYGAPIGFRLAARHPQQITAIISQNGNVYQEGLGEKWAARKQFWQHPTEEQRQRYRSTFDPNMIRHQYTDGTPAHTVSPDGYTLDSLYMSRPGNDEKQLDLIYDYRTNVDLYPLFQHYLREHQPPLLAVWGQNDASFIPAGAHAFAQDVPNAEIHLLDTGHFALETHAKTIGNLIVDFWQRRCHSSHT
ncbi:alpha/beta fold hydrolase [Paenibacillus sp. WLX2291]|uniref:alpha/beta fold hydrolase n=1 Tax=Paenibacillus sp. WLX2291 TaxID=3296934 RepID=UPI003983E639